jgi:hypothetical protein
VPRKEDWYDDKNESPSHLFIFPLEPNPQMHL